MKISSWLYKYLSPLRILVMGFIVITLIGTFLLMLPESSVNGTSQSFIDALFTATSGVSTTGLVVVDTGSYYTLFGQWVLLVLIQIGGLGYMVFIVMVFLGQRKEISINGRKIMRESLSRPLKIDMTRFSKIVFIFTFTIEFLGMLGMFIYWSHFFPVSRAVYVSLFHSVSGFCTAGFGLFSDSITTYGHSYYLNAVIDLVCIAGAAGFFVLYDIYDYTVKKIKGLQPVHLSLHSKIVISVTFILIIIGSIAVFGFEGSAFSSSTGNKILDSTFQVISASTTTGFNTIDIGSMTKPSLLIIIILMFIGASPGSTGGGIKTTSFAVFMKHIYSVLRGVKDTVLFRRKINNSTITNVTVLTAISAMWISSVVIILCATENTTLIRILFETVSAFGTVGLSTGITSSLSATGKVLITITMFLGRVGPLALGFSLLKGKEANGYHYPEEEILIG
jgi:trk system potassium uptake protein TrkH